MGTRCADHVTPLYPQKLALTSPTGGGRSVGIVRSRTKATEFIYIYIKFASLGPAYATTTNVSVDPEVYDNLTESSTKDRLDHAG